MIEKGKITPELANITLEEQIKLVHDETRVKKITLFEPKKFEKFELAEPDFDSSVVDHWSKKFCNTNNLLPLGMKGDCFRFAMKQYVDIDALEKKIRYHFKISAKCDQDFPYPLDVEFNFYIVNSLSFERYIEWLFSNSPN